MSLLAITSALEAHLAGMSPEVATAYENEAFDPPGPATPYQRVSHFPDAPLNTENTAAHIARGFMQVTLAYPLAEGAGPALTRAELVRLRFYRGLSLTSGGITATVEATPALAPAMTADDRYLAPITIRWFAHIAS